MGGRTERCPVCGEPVAIGDADAIHLHGGGLMHESCLAECDDLESSQAEIERQQRSERRAKERKAG